MVLGTSAGWTGHLAKAVHQAKVDHQGQGSHLTRLHIWKWSEMHNGIFPDLYLTSPSSSETKLILRFFLRPELFLRSENFFLGPEFISQYQKVFPGTRNFSLGPEIFPGTRKQPFAICWTFSLPAWEYSVENVQLSCSWECSECLMRMSSWDCWDCLRRMFKWAAACGAEFDLGLFWGLQLQRAFGARVVLVEGCAKSHFRLVCLL